MEQFVFLVTLHEVVVLVPEVQNKLVVLLLLRLCESFDPNDGHRALEIEFFDVCDFFGGQENVSVLPKGIAIFLHDFS